MLRKQATLFCLVLIAGTSVDGSKIPNTLLRRLFQHPVDKDLETRTSIGDANKYAEHIDDVTDDADDDDIMKKWHVEDGGIMDDSRDVFIEDDGDIDDLQERTVLSLDERVKADGTLTSKDKRAILKAHNQARRAVVPTAANMKKLVGFSFSGAWGWVVVC